MNGKGDIRKTDIEKEKKSKKKRKKRKKKEKVEHGRIMMLGAAGDVADADVDKHHSIILSMKLVVALHSL